MRWCIGAALLLLACNPRNLSKVKPILEPPPEVVDFGTLPVLNEKRVEVALENLGRAPLNLSNLALAKTDGIFSIVTPVERVAGGELQNLVLAFKPLKEQAYTDTLTFDTDDTELPKVEVSLTGQGSTRAIVEVEPAMVDFGRVPECASSVQQLTIRSKGTADLIIEEISLTPETNPAFGFVGSTRTPAVVKTTGANGLPGQILLTIRLSVAAMTSGTLTGAIKLKTTDPDQREVLIPLTATVNRAPVPSIAPLGNGSPGQLITLDGSGSMDAEGDTPLVYKWTIRSKPLASTTTIADPAAASTSMQLDAQVPGAYEVQLDVTDSQGVKSCAPARATVVAAPAQKLLVEMFWDNAATDLDLHVLRDPMGSLGSAPDDCFYQNRTPDWGMPMGNDDPELMRDALTGYGPEVFGYVNPVDSTYRVAVVFANELLSPMPASTATVRVYLYGVLKAEARRTMQKRGDAWQVLDVTWPSGEVKVLP
jgi:hypothetical protein